MIICSALPGRQGPPPRARERLGQYLHADWQHQGLKFSESWSAYETPHFQRQCQTAQITRHDLAEELCLYERLGMTEQLQLKL